MMTFKHILHCSVVGQDFPLRSRLASAGAPLCSRMLRVLTGPPSPENLPTEWAGHGYICKMVAQDRWRAIHGAN